MPCRKHITCTTISLTRLKIRITCNLGHMTSVPTLISLAANLQNFDSGDSTLQKIS